MLDDIIIDDINFDESVPIDIAIIRGKEITTGRIIPQTKAPVKPQSYQTFERPPVPSYPLSRHEDFSESGSILPAPQTTSPIDVEIEERIKIIPNKPLKLGKIPFSIPTEFNANRIELFPNTLDSFQEVLPIALLAPPPKQQEFDIVIEAIKNCSDPTFRQSYLTKKLRNTRLNAARIKQILLYLVSKRSLLVENNEPQPSSPNGGRKQGETYRITDTFKELYCREGEEHALSHENIKTQ